MRRFLVLMVMSVFTILPAFSQPNNEPPAKSATDQKLYLPLSAIDDPIALEKAIGQVATQVLTKLPKKGMAYHKQAANYYLLSGEYKKASDAIDSVRKAEGDPFWRSYFKAYVEAKMMDDTEGDVFKQKFQKDFTAEYNRSSFDQKVAFASIDSTYVSEINSQFKSGLAELKSKGSDSITLEEAKEFLPFYRDYMVYNKIFPLASPYIKNPKYKKSYPAIKGNAWGAVYPVEGIDEVPDPKMQYKFIMELTSFGMPKQEDSVTSKEINLALRDISRTINLHVGAGIPKEKIDVVLAVHASALKAFLNNEKYKKKYGIDNPNIPLIKELQDFGVKITLCGQAMYFQNLPREHFIPGVKVALTSQTVISSYQLKGYVFSDLSLRE